MNLLRERPEVGGTREFQRRGESFQKERSENLSLAMSGGRERDRGDRMIEFYQWV